MTDGQQLLAQYAESGSETAFRELVTRYVDLVYSAAVRLVNGDTHLAEDVTQTVFADLARMARALSREVRLGGWLHRHTCFVASKTMRGERRRQARERQAAEMNANEDHSAANLARVAPELDDAINQLGSEDRAAILLRFFEQRDFRSVGKALGSNEEAARKRVDRALDKLESLLKRRGVALSATALGATLATQAVTAAPVGLAISISGAALASATTGGGTALTFLKIMGMTTNPEMYKLIRDQQKMGLNMIYKDFTNRMKFPPEQGDKLVNLLADNVMENIDRITEVLRDGKGAAEMEQVFGQQDAALKQKLQALLGPEGYAQYEDYTHNLASFLTAEQFKGMMTGDKDAKDEKGKQLYALMQEETRAALAEAGLPADFQTVPTLNFRNIASEEAGERTLTLLDGIYGRVAARAGSFLSPEEVGKFGEFRKIAINGNRMGLAVNRKMMAPGPK